MAKKAIIIRISIYISIPMSIYFGLKYYFGPSKKEKVDTKVITSINQSGGITADRVDININPQPPLKEPKLDIYYNDKLISGISTKVKKEGNVIKLPLEQQEQQVTFPSVNLEHDAKVARYYKYIYNADQLIRESNFKDAIKFYESAFSLAESDESLDDYASGGNYYYKKILLWQCYLEVSEREGIHECLRNAFNMGMDENEILKMFQRQNSYTTTLRCDHYFYLLLQEKLFLFDEEYRERGSVDNRLQRIKNLMDLIEDPFCPQKDEQLVQRAKGIERQVQDEITKLIPGRQ